MNESASIFSDKKFDSAFDKSKLWLKFLQRKWIYILLFFVLGAIAGILYAKKQSLQYESFLTFSLDEASKSSGGGLSSFVAQFGIGTAENDLFSGDNIIEVIKSRTILERVLLSTDRYNNKEISLIDYFNALQSKKTSILFPIGFNRENATVEQDSLLYKVYTDILKYNLMATRPDKRLNIYVIKFRSSDEKFTKIFTDKILSETIKFYTELKTKKSESTLQLLEQRVAAIKGNANESISQKANIQDANVNPAFSAAQIPLQKQQLNIQVYGAAYVELYKNLELARFQFLQDIPLLQVINNTNYPMIRIKPSLLKMGMAGAAIIALLALFFFSLYYWVKK